MPVTPAYTAPPRHPRAAWAAGVLAAALFLAHSLLLYGYTGRDDAFLTYWPALQFAEHADLLNYNGERVEQSSTLLHTFLRPAYAT